MSEEIKTPPGTLAVGEAHPASRSALHYIASLGIGKQMEYLEAFSSCAIEDNRLAEVCAETLRRVIHGEPVSDRYICALAWTCKEMGEELGVDL
jgi:hypothetical protein